MGIVMRGQILLLLLGALAAVAISMPADQVILDDTDLGESDMGADEAKLKDKLAKLEHTYNRVKKSCTANDVPKELGEDDDAGETQKVSKVEELEQKIKKKNAAIDKIADACMPGMARAALLGEE